jgi:CheY-like chemotaxis protein
VALVQKNGRTQRVLIIDDEPQVRVSLRETLEAAGYEVVEAENGMVAVDYLSDVKPDVMITDIFMPEKEGIATIRDYRSLYPDLPIIAISGANNMASERFLEVAEKLGADHTLAKPFGPHELLNIVREALNDR